MIAGIFHEGSGLGDQLFRYITVRTLAEEKGMAWGFCNYSQFKGSEFMQLDTGIPIGSPKAMLVTHPRPFKRWEEKVVRDTQGNDIRSYDPEINFVKNATVIDGSFEDSKYWHHNLENINKWLAVEPLEVRDDLCVIGFRGGEYATQPDLFLTPEYWNEALDMMKGKTCEVHTDDPELAKQFFTPIPIVENSPISHSKHTNMALNWRSARYAKYAIIPNSAFFIIPRLLKHFEDPTAVTIAPRGWSRRNLAKGNNAGAFLWARPACWYREFTYI